LLDDTADGTADVGGFFDEVAGRCRAGIIDGLVITGGEPVMQPDIADFLRECKTAGIPVKLDTNGSNPEILRLVFAEQLAFFVAMDVKAPFAKYDALCGCHVDAGAIRESIALIASSGHPHQFRTTLVSGMLDESDIADIRAMLPPGENLILQDHRPA